MPRRPVRDWLLVPEIAAYFHIKPQQIRAFILQNKFPHAEKVGKSWSVPLLDIKRFEAERIKIGRPVGMISRRIKAKKEAKDGDSKY